MAKQFLNDKPHIMVYNTQHEHLIIPEYGRNIQKLVEYACEIKDKEERNKVANAIIAIMGRLNPNLRDTDFRHKLWDHLFIISNFKLNVDSPYPIPTKETLSTKPKKVEYPKRNIAYKHYGKAIQLLIAKASLLKEGEEKKAFVEAIANQMKKSYLIWNHNSVYDQTILDELKELSDGKLSVSENFHMNNTQEILARSRSIKEDTSSGENRRGSGRDRGRGFGGGGRGRNNRNRRPR